MASDGKGYEPTRGADDRYQAAVYLEHALIGGLGGVDCLNAKHNSPDCRYVLDTGEVISADRSTHKAAQPFFVPFDDAQWLETEGEPVALATLKQAAEPFAFPMETGVADRPAPAAVQSAADDFAALEIHHVDAEQITHQTVQDIRAVMTDSRVTALAADREAWVKVISALCGSIAQASEYADELEQIAIQWGDSAPEYAGETVVKIERERHRFTRSNPAAVFNLAKSVGVPNPATLRAEARRNDMAVLGGIRARHLHPWEVDRLESLNGKYGHALVAGKAVIVYADTVNRGGDPVHEVRYARGNELANMMQHEDAIYGFTMLTDKDGNEIKKPGSPMLPLTAWQCWKGHTMYMGGVDFYPDQSKCPSDVFNLWRGWNVAPEVGDISPWLELVQNAICAGNKEHAQCFIGYWAHMVQHPDVKPRFAIVLRGKAGGGKGSVLTPIHHFTGQAFAAVQGLSKVAGKFNSVIAGKLSVMVDEARQSGKDAADALKVLISENVVTIEKKGIDPEPVSNFARVCLLSNHQDAVYVMDNERRFFYLDVTDKYVVNLQPEAQEFWRKYHAWLNNGGAGKLLHYLQTFDLPSTGFDPNVCPITEALTAETAKTLPDVESWMLAELAQPLPFGVRAHREAWDKANLEDWSVLDAQIGEPLTSGGVQTKIMHTRAALWINENVNRYSVVKVQPHTIDKRVNKLVKDIFDMQKSRQTGRNSPVIFYFADLNYARCQFAHAVGINVLEQFPEEDFPGMQDAFDRFIAAQNEVTE